MENKEKKEKLVKVCPSCGAHNEERRIFCKNCHEFIDEVEPVSADAEIFSETVTEKEKADMFSEEECSFGQNTDTLFGEEETLFEDVPPVAQRRSFKVYVCGILAACFVALVGFLAGLLAYKTADQRKSGKSETEVSAVMETSEAVSEEFSEKIAEEVLEEFSERVTEVSEELSDKVTEVLEEPSEKIADDTSEVLSEEILEEVKEMTEQKPAKLEDVIDGSPVPYVSFSMPVALGDSDEAMEALTDLDNATVWVGSNSGLDNSFVFELAKAQHVTQLLICNGYSKEAYEQYTRLRKITVEVKLAEGGTDTYYFDFPEEYYSVYNLSLQSDLCTEIEICITSVYEGEKDYLAVRDIGIFSDEDEEAV